MNYLCDETGIREEMEKEELVFIFFIFSLPISSHLISPLNFHIANISLFSSPFATSSPTPILSILECSEASRQSVTQCCYSEKSPRLHRRYGISDVSAGHLQLLLDNCSASIFFFFISFYSLLFLLFFLFCPSWYDQRSVGSGIGVDKGRDHGPRVCTDVSS